MTLPLFARKFIVDFTETALATVFALAFAFPASVEDLKAVAVAVGVGVVGAAISAARRAVPGFLGWESDVLAVPQDTAVPPSPSGDST